MLGDSVGPEPAWNISHCFSPSLACDNSTCICFATADTRTLECRLNQDTNLLGVQERTCGPLSDGINIFTVVLRLVKLGVALHARGYTSRYWGICIQRSLYLREQLLDGRDGNSRRMPFQEGLYFLLHVGLGSWRDGGPLWEVELGDLPLATSLGGKTNSLIVYKFESCFISALQRTGMQSSLHNEKSTPYAIYLQLEWMSGLDI